MPATPTETTSKAAAVGPKLVVPPPLEKEKAPPKESALTVIDADQKQHPPRPAKAKVKPTDPKHPRLKKATTLAPTSKPDQNILQTFGSAAASRQASCQGAPRTHDGTVGAQQQQSSSQKVRKNVYHRQHKQQTNSNFSRLTTNV
ncbi:hypothetical protein E2562_008542 [Oryza meyeriana var. granulata]|uniref:Uncharacterized protein n=1 Tax=Oryza meyeriana var. granulata TaxID=110450 RepID=A0A6G1C4V7_9ORYZ|nr:hypothetical protein E2562_008542 [Oryza meyeriana var. granulata]